MRQRTLSVVLFVLESALSVGLLICLVLFERGISGIIHHPPLFVPVHQVPGIGLGREKMSGIVLAERTERMIEEQKFGILRSPVALQCAERILALQPVFEEASRESGFSQTMLQGMAWIESCGNPQAKSPTGPRGVMQFTATTGRVAGLKIGFETRYKKVRVFKYRGRGKNRRKVAVWKKIPYVVAIDERLDIKKSIRAAAHYLKRMERKFGGEDLAVFSYHCGEGCVSQLVALGRRAFGGQVTMAKLFFLNHPGESKQIYKAIQRHMGRDWSPTYWFRVTQAARLFALYQKDPVAFRRLYESYRRNKNWRGQVPNRMWYLLSPRDIIYETLRDLDPRLGGGRGLAPLFEDPEYFGFKLRKSGVGPVAEKDLGNQHLFLQNSPAANGALLYLAFETRRLHREAYPREEFVPLDITALVRHLEYQGLLKSGNVNAQTTFPTHCSGQVFDCSYLHLPKGERECLKFVLDDLEYDGRLTFIEEVRGSSTFHIVVAPAARPFFTQVFEEARSARSK